MFLQLELDIKKKIYEAGEMAQLRVSTAQAEDQGSILWTHMVANNHKKLQFQEAFFWPLRSLHGHRGT